MVATDRSEKMSGISRVKLWKYRYALMAITFTTLFLTNHFYFDRSLAGLGNFETISPANAPPHTGADNALSQGHQESSSTSTTAVAAVDSASKTPRLFSLGNYKFDEEYVGWPLQRVCKESTFQPGLTFICDNNSGGIGNIRNFILTCMRYAIDAGASQIILPQIQRRSDDDLGNLFTSKKLPFGYFFDEEHFRYAMNTFCPQMKIFDGVEVIPYAEERMNVEEVYPKDLASQDGCDERGVNRHLDMFRKNFDGFLNITKRTPTTTAPVTIRFRWATFFEWPIYRDGPEFAATFGDILRIRKDIQYLAARGLEEMSRFVGVEPKPDKFDLPYLGVHLRTESDALGFWPDFDTQSDGYLEQAKKRNITHAYLACGNATEGLRFADKALEKNGMKVALKLDLLSGSDLEALAELSWDQQALVDYLILSKSSHFTGCSFSSFTMNIAFKRHLMTGSLQTRPWKSPGDEYTTLIGRFDNWFGDWMFMYECMWP
jgi:hypothetical protein